MAEEGHLPPRNNGWIKTLAPMEHGTPSEILPVEMMVNNFPLSPNLFTLLVSLNFLISFPLFGQVFATIIFNTLLSPRGQVLFLQL